MQKKKESLVREKENEESSKKVVEAAVLHEEDWGISVVDVSLVIYPPPPHSGCSE